MTLKEALEYLQDYHKEMLGQQVKTLHFTYGVCMPNGELALGSDEYNKKEV